MNILIIKNDGFGDLVIIKDLLKKINKKNFILISFYLNTMKFFLMN